MKLNDNIASAFDAFPEPNEIYREGCFSFQKWIFETESQDVKWVIMKREFVTLNEQVFEWLDKFPITETIRLDCKRLIWDVKYENYRTYRFSHPVLIALCVLKLSCDLHRVNFSDIMKDCIAVTKKDMEYKKILGMRLSDYSMLERIREKSNQLSELIGDKKINDIKLMWGCVDEAVLRA